MFALHRWVRVWWYIALLGVSSCAEPARPAVELNVPQRSTMLLPGWQDAVSVRVGDITRGRVLVEVLADDKTIAGPRPLRESESLPFKRGSQRFNITLNRLDNSLIGEDYARFSVGGADDTSATSAAAEPAAMPAVATVDSLIEQRLQQLAGMTDVRFIRNGQEYPAADAVAHLRQKWRHRSDEVRSLDDFIRLCASHSEQSGLPYQLKLADGRVVELGPWLRELR